MSKNVCEECGATGQTYACEAVSTIDGERVEVELCARCHPGGTCGVCGAEKEPHDCTEHRCSST